MRNFLTKFFVSCICLWALCAAQVALSQASSNKWDQKPIDYKYKFHDSVIVRDAWTEAFDFMIETTKRNNIGQGLQRLHEKQMVQDRDQFQYWMPDTKIGKDTSSPEVSDRIKSDFGFAAARQAMETFSFLKKISRSLSFKVNLLEIEKDDEAEERRRRNFSIRPQRRAPDPKDNQQQGTPQATLPPASGGFGLATPDSSSYIQQQHEPHQEKWRQMGNIEADLTPNSNPNSLINQDPNQSRFIFSLSQGNGFYTLNLPVGAGNTTDGLTHALRVPTIGHVDIGQDFDANGRRVSTGLYNILSAESPFDPKLNLIYEHQEQRYGSSCTMKSRNNSEFSVKTTTPAPQKISEKDLANKGAEYTLSYGMPI